MQALYTLCTSKKIYYDAPMNTKTHVTIQQKLIEIEKEHEVTILYAVE